MNCIAVIEPKKKIVGIAKAWTDNQRTVKIGYVRVSADFLVVIKRKISTFILEGILKKNWNQMKFGAMLFSTLVVPHLLNETKKR